jgi:hypothetical protein
VVVRAAARGGRGASSSVINNAAAAVAATPPTTMTRRTLLAAGPASAAALAALAAALPAATLLPPAAGAAVTLRIKSNPKLRMTQTRAGPSIGVPDSYSVAYDRSDGPEQLFFTGNFKTFETISISKAPLANLGLEALDGAGACGVLGGGGVFV